MIDSVLIQDGRAHQIWPGKSKTELPPLHRDFLARVVEVHAGTVAAGDLWDGYAFTTPPAPPRVMTYSAFRDLWTTDEREALHTARLAHWQIDDFVGLAQAQNAVNLSGATAAAAKAALIDVGVLSPKRADVLFKSGDSE